MIYELFQNYVPPFPLCLEKWAVMTPQLLWERRPWTWLFDTWRSVTFVKVSLPSLELRRLDTDLFDSVFFG